MRKDGGKAAEAFKSLFKAGDLLLLVVLLIAVALSVWVATRPDGSEARVYVDGELRCVLPLSKDGETQLADVGMVITVADGKVSVKESNCPEQLCVHSAPISGKGGMIVCLPNRVVITVGGEVDAIT